MNNTPWWSGGRLLAAATALACTGAWFLDTGLTGRQADRPTTQPSMATYMAHPASTTATTARQPAASGERTASASPEQGASPHSTSGRSADPAGPTGAASASELPPPGSGPAADPLIQQALDRATPPDLPTAAEQHLLAAGRAAWLTEAAGYTQVRIQAATARRDSAAPGSGESAVVRLVWAGADRAGTFLDGRAAAVRFTRNGEGSWDRTL
ncbi:MULTISPECIES: hypothetical protein [unclassified Streptomyces]|uniref:hypothetical protein n=1 Tax=unclassified Streptomyces TaxID=2593676 RepID=UPI0032565AA8